MLAGPPAVVGQGLCGVALGRNRLNMKPKTRDTRVVFSVVLGGRWGGHPGVSLPAKNEEEKKGVAVDILITTTIIIINHQGAKHHITSSNCHVWNGWNSAESYDMSV